MRPILLSVLRNEQTRSWLMDRFGNDLDSNHVNATTNPLVWELNEIPTTRVSPERASSVLLCHGRLGRHLLGTVHSTSLARSEMPRNPGVILLSRRFVIDMDQPNEVVQMLRFADKTYLLTVLVFDQTVGIRFAEYILLDSHRHSDVPNKVLQRSVIITRGCDPHDDPLEPPLVNSWVETRAWFLSMSREATNNRATWRVYEPGSGSILREVPLSRRFTIRDACTMDELELLPERFQPPRSSVAAHEGNHFLPLSSQYVGSAAETSMNSTVQRSGLSTNPHIYSGHSQMKSEPRQGTQPSQREAHKGVDAFSLQSHIFNLRDRPLSVRLVDPAHTESDVRLLATVKDLCSSKVVKAPPTLGRSSPITSPDHPDESTEGVEESSTRKAVTMSSTPARPTTGSTRPTGHGANETRFFCPMCNAGFAAKSNMNRHIRMVHEKLKPFRCEGCGVGFVQGSGLRRHMQRFHGAPNSSPDEPAGVDGAQDRLRSESVGDQ